MSTLFVDTLEPNQNTAITAAAGKLLPVGHVVQVTSDSLNTAVSTSGTSFADTGLSANITPSSTSSKIFIVCNLGLVSTSTSDGILFKLLRDSTEIGQGTGGTQNRFMAAYMNANNEFYSYSNSFLDSPSTTSSITYKLQFRMSGGTDTGYINRRASDAYAVTSSNFTLMEIAQ